LAGAFSASLACGSSAGAAVVTGSVDSAFLACAAFWALAVLVALGAAGCLGVVFVLDIAVLLGLGFDGRSAIARPAELPADESQSAMRAKEHQAKFRPAAPEFAVFFPGRFKGAHPC